MSSLYSDRVTYPELLKFYYACGLPEILGPAANSVAHAIMFKANELFFPDSFRMSNVELARLSGIGISHIGRSRQKVLTDAIVNEMPLFTYTSRGKRMAGIYRINTTILPDKHQHITRELPVSYLYGNDHNKQTATEHNDHDPPKPPLVMPGREEAEKISVPAAGYEKEWKESIKEQGNSKLPGQIAFNALIRIFQRHPEIFGKVTADHEDTANDVCSRLSLEDGWRILYPSEKADSPLAWIRKMGNKKGKEWSR